MLDAARELLPLPICYGNALLYPLLAAIGAALILAIAYRLARPRLPADAHWTDRAKEYFCGLKVLIWATVLPLLAAIGAGSFYTGPLGFIDRFGLIAVLAVAITATATPFFGANQLRAMPWLDKKRLRGGRLGHLLLRHPDRIPMLLVFALLPADPGLMFFLVLVPGLALWLYLNFGGGLRLALWFGLARPAPERVQRIVKRVAEQIGHPPPVVLTVEMNQANVYALPLGNLMCFSERAEEVLTDEELGRIAAHEMSHLGEAKRDTMKRLFPLLMPLVIMAARPASMHLPGNWYLILLGAALYLRLRQPRAIRRLEETADQDAHGEDDAAAATFAAGLEKLYRENLTPAVMSKKPLSHPELYDRLLAAGVTPDYPRPPPPRSVLVSTILMCLLSAVLFVVLALGGIALKASARRSETVALGVIAVTGGDEEVLMDLARHRRRAGRPEEALVFRFAAAEIEVRSKRR